MATDDELRASLNEKLVAQIELEVARLKKELAAVRNPSRWGPLKAGARSTLKHLPTLGLIVTAVLGILAYQQGQIERKRELFSDLVARLIEHRSLESYDAFISMSTLSALRERYAREPDYAFEVAFISLPYVFLEKSHEDLRILAARTLSEAIGGIDDAEQHYRLNSLFMQRQSVFETQPADITPLFQRYSALVVCALVDSSIRNDLPEKGDPAQCEKWRKENLLPL